MTAFAPGPQILSVSRSVACTRLAFLGCALVLAVQSVRAENALKHGPIVTFAGNLDGSYHSTQFFEQNHDAVAGIWDARIEFWLPPYRTQFSWGPYVPLRGIAATRDQPWENVGLAEPGAGFQVFPFSYASLRQPGSPLGFVLGPIRLFGEVARQNFRGSLNDWRPRDQVRFGFDYWRALYVNDQKAWWAEIWSGAWHQKTNEFDASYDSTLFGTSIRAGLRFGETGILSSFSGYLAGEGSLSDNPAYFWENRLMLGGGLRFAPVFSDSSATAGSRWVSGFVVYAEYLNSAHYLRGRPVPGTPRHDFRAGVGITLGDWFR